MRSLANIFKSILLAILGLTLGGLVTLVAGESPLNVLRIIVNGVSGTPYDIGLTVYYATILTFVGLAVAVPFRAGVFNIGGEGQLSVGALSCALTALYFGDGWPAPVAGAVGVLAAFAGGALWGAIIGWIRAWRGGHEVISSIMMNFIASGVTGWLTINHFRASDSQNAETNEIATVWRWSSWDSFAGAPVTSLTIVCFICAVLIWAWLKFSAQGFAIKSVQESPDAAGVAGTSVAKVRFWTLTLGGGLAGLAGAVMVLGAGGRFRLGISEGFGFTGIPVALLGKGHPLGVVASAVLFAVLHHGSSALDLEATRVGRDLSQVMQALVMIVVTCGTVFSWQGMRNRFFPQDHKGGEL